MQSKRHKKNKVFSVLFQYDAETPGRYGGGGEYIVQAGFGWTNGAIMELLNTYGAELRCTDKDICEMSGEYKVKHRVRLLNNEVFRT